MYNDLSDGRRILASLPGPLSAQLQRIWTGLNVTLSAIYIILHVYHTYIRSHSPSRYHWRERRDGRLRCTWATLPRALATDVVDNIGRSTSAEPNCQHGINIIWHRSTTTSEQHTKRTTWNPRWQPGINIIGHRSTTISEQHTKRTTWNPWEQMLSKLHSYWTYLRSHSSHRKLRSSARRHGHPQPTQIIIINVIGDIHLHVAYNDHTSNFNFTTNNNYTTIPTTHVYHPTHIVHNHNVNSFNTVNSSTFNESNDNSIFFMTADE